MYGSDFKPDDLRRKLKRVGFKEEGLNAQIEATLVTRQQEKLDALALQAVVPAPVRRPLPQRPLPQFPIQAPAMLAQPAIPQPMLPPEMKPQIEVAVDDNQPMMVARKVPTGGKRAPKAPNQYKTYDNEEKAPKAYLPMKDSVSVLNTENTAPVEKPKVMTAGGHNPEELKAAMERIAKRNMCK